MMWIECSDVVGAWMKEHPDEDIEVEGFRLDLKRHIEKKSEFKEKSDGSP
jgi:hypothetical protein